MSFLDTKVEEIKEGIKLHFLHLEGLDDEIISIINKTIIAICSGPDYDTTVETQKRELKLLLEDKRGSSQELGHISEFFIHLYLNYCGFKQACLFENLEEKRAIKKGFDGYYLDENNQWLVESKSGNIISHNNTHKNKINEAYNDLSDKVSGNNLSKNGTPISPWKNAYFHAKQSNTKLSILKRINKLSEEFNNGVFHNISEFSIIPSSTIFFDGKAGTNDSVEDFDTVKGEVLDRINGKEIKEGHIICFSQSTKDLLLNYLNTTC